MFGASSLSLARMSLYRHGPASDLGIGIERDCRRRNCALAFFAGAVAVLVVGLLVAKIHSSRDAVAAAAGVDQLMTTAPGVGARVRVQGDFVPGSLVRQASPCESRFTLEKNGFRVPVRHASCVLSDPFEAAAQDGDPVPMTVEGELKPTGFVATDLRVMVPSCCFCSREAEREKMKVWHSAAPSSRDAQR